MHLKVIFAVIIFIYLHLLLRVDMISNSMAERKWFESEVNSLFY